MESFAVEHVSNLSSKIIFAEVAMFNFIAQHNLSFATVDQSSTQIWSKILQKKMISTQMGDLEVGSTALH